MAGRELVAGDIVILDPGDATDFTALEPTTTVVIKMPSVAGEFSVWPAAPQTITPLS